MNVVVQRVLFSSCQQWMYLYYCDYFVEACTVVHVCVINSPNRHSDSPNCNVINKTLRDEFAVSHGIGKRASLDHGLDSTIPVTMWTYPVTFCCKWTVPVTKTFPFQSPNRHCWRRASRRGGERGKPRMGHWAWFPLRCEPRLSTLSISGREQSQQCRRPRGDIVERVAKIEFSVPKVHKPLRIKIGRPNSVALLVIDTGAALSIPHLTE